MTDAVRLTKVFANGEPVFARDTKKLWIGDGVTLGGVDPSTGAAPFTVDASPTFGSKVYTPVSAGDRNGLFYDMRLTSGNIFQNIDTNGGGTLVSTIGSTAGGVGTFAAYAGLYDGTSASSVNYNSAVGQYFVVDIRASLVMSHYMLSVGNANRYTRSWKVQGTNTMGSFSIAGANAATWVDLDVRTGDGTMTMYGVPFLYTANQSVATAYRYFRILSTGADSSTNFYLDLSEIEFYGTATRSASFILPGGAKGWMKDSANRYIPYY